MVITTLTSKNQTTIGMEFVNSLGLKPGMRLKQSRVKEGILIEPIGDILSAFGSLQSDVRFTSIADEDAAVEAAIVEDVLASMRRE